MFEIEHNAEIAVLKMNHGKVNAMSVEFCHEIKSQLRLLEQSEARAIVLTSSQKVFSAGVDLVRLIDEDVEYVDEFVPALCELLATPMRINKPVVAAVNGFAIAGGCVLACSCDYRVISDNASIGMPEMRLGVPLPAVPMEVVRSVIAAQEFKRLIHLGSSFVGSDAVQVGLADESCAAEQLLENAIIKARQLTRIPPDTFALSKRQMRTPVEERIAYGNQHHDGQVIELWKSEPVRNMIREYVAERLSK